MPSPELTYLNTETSLAGLYHENSKFFPRIPHRMPDLSEKQLLYAQARAFKVYDDISQIQLPREFSIEDTPLSELIHQRRTRRDMTGETLSITQLSALLSLSMGAVDTYVVDRVTLIHRAFPSAGALYPLEVYPLIVNVEGVPSGVYHYDVRHHALDQLKEQPMGDLVTTCCPPLPFVLQPSLVLAITAMFPRTMSKYHERGYRYVMLDAGHAAQNVYLVGTALEIGVVALGGFFDDLVNDMLEVDGVEESVIYLIACGRLPSG